MKRLFSSQFRANLTISGAGAAVNAAITILVYPVYLYFLGYEQLGLWVVLNTVLGMVQMGDLGISAAVMKIVAHEHALGSISAIRSYITIASLLLTACGAACLALICVFASNITAAFALEGANASLVTTLLPYIGAVSVCVLIGEATAATLSGLGRMDLSNYVQSGGRLLAAVVSIVLLYLKLGVTSILIGSAASALFVVLASLVLIRKTLGASPLSARDWTWQQFRSLTHFGGGVFGAKLFVAVMNPFNKLIISRCCGVSDVPVYEISYNAAMQVRGLMDAALKAFVPEISRIGSSLTADGMMQILDLNTRALRTILLWCLPLYLMLAVLSAPVLKLWLGSGYRPQLAPVFAVMVIASYISLLSVPAYYTMLGLGHVRFCFYSCLLQTAVNMAVVMVLLSAGYTFSPIYGSVAVLAGMAASTLYLLSSIKRMSHHMQVGLRQKIQCSTVPVTD